MEGASGIVQISRSGPDDGAAQEHRQTGTGHGPAQVAPLGRA